MYVDKSVFNDNLGSRSNQCYTKNGLIMSHVLKRFRFSWLPFLSTARCSRLKLASIAEEAFCSLTLI